MATPAVPATHKKSTQLPNDARLIALLLASRGVEDADERVLHQLLDFAHRYTTELFKDANAFAQYDDRSGLFGPGPGSSSSSGQPATSTAGASTSKKTTTGTGAAAGDELKGLKVEDVEMAVRARSGWEFQEGAPKDYLLPLSRQLNALPLPILPESHAHIRLPPRNQMLGTLNFEFVPNRRSGAEDDGSDSGSGSYSGSESGSGSGSDDEREGKTGHRTGVHRSNLNGQNEFPSNANTNGKRKRSYEDDPDGDGDVNMVGEDDLEEDQTGGGGRSSRPGGASDADADADGDADGDNADEEADGEGSDDDEDMEEVPAGSAGPVASSNITPAVGITPAAGVQKRQIEEDDNYDD